MCNVQHYNVVVKRPFLISFLVRRNPLSETVFLWAPSLAQAPVLTRFGEPAGGVRGFQSPISVFKLLFQTFLISPRTCGPSKRQRALVYLKFDFAICGFAVCFLDFFVRGGQPCRPRQPTWQTHPEFVCGVERPFLQEHELLRTRLGNA